MNLKFNAGERKLMESATENNRLIGSSLFNNYEEPAQLKKEFLSGVPNPSTSSGRAGLGLR
jgi:hypothetical protein